VIDELHHPERHSAARRALVREMFHEPGTATARALTMAYRLIDLPMPHAAGVTVGDAHVAASAL
jgi:hypothetical protein